MVWDKTFLLLLSLLSASSFLIVSFFSAYVPFLFLCLEDNISFGFSFAFLSSPSSSLSSSSNKLVPNFTFVNENAFHANRQYARPNVSSTRKCVLQNCSNFVAMTLLNANDARKLSMPKNCSNRFISAISKSSESSALSFGDFVFLVGAFFVFVSSSSFLSSVFCFFLAFSSPSSLSSSSSSLSSPFNRGCFVSSLKIFLSGLAHTHAKVRHAVKKSAALTRK